LSSFSGFLWHKDNSQLVGYLFPELQIMGNEEDYTKAG